MKKRRSRAKSVARLNLPGLVAPSDYDFEKTFLELAGTYQTMGQFAELNLSLVLGLARAYAQLLEQTRPKIHLVKPEVRGGSAVSSDTRL